MPGSEYYDRDPSESEIAYEIDRRKREKQKWETAIGRLMLVDQSISSPEFSRIVNAARDYAKARIWEIKI